MKRVLLTGGSGFIGSGILKYMLAHTDWRFTCVASWRHKGTPLNLRGAWDDERCEIITHDLTGIMPEIGQFDYILHLASESHVDRSIAEPLGFIENNVSSTLQVLEYARKHKPEAFILFSTDEVYGATEHGEWDVLLPSNPYAASKAAQEMIAIAYWKTYGLPIVITNSNNIVGENQDAEKFVPKLINLIGSGDEVQVHTFNGVPGKRYYNPVQNVADALLFILKRKPSACFSPSTNIAGTDRPDRYNLAGGKELDNLEMAQLIASLLDRPLKYKLLDAESLRPGYDQFYAKTDGALRQLGWAPPLTLEEGLQWVSR
jgi:dTDP-glucose 4,6-dehydratase